MNQMKRKIAYSLLAGCIAISSFSAPLMAHSHGHCYTRNGMQNGGSTMNAQGCHAMYQKLVDAVVTLKREGVFTDKEIAAIHEFFATVPKEVLDAAPDKNMAIADALLKGKIITQEQYNKIVEYLKK